MLNTTDRASLRASYWASFVGTPYNETMFAGLYHVEYRGLLEQDTPAPHMDDVYKAGSSDVYDLTLAQALGDLVGKLLIDWGPGYRKWAQRADRGCVLEARGQTVAVNVTCGLKCMFRKQSTTSNSIRETSFRGLMRLGKPRQANTGTEPLAVASGSPRQRIGSH
jgi:hypothetical protein